MNIVLLSGGSGKRLWPLSNQVRSKQFIKLFRNEKKEYESMVQRMYRQIKKIDRSSIVTVATSKSQVSELKNQLGEDVEISIEPSRRDTFPAIVLAASYLADIKKINPEEPIVVCPVDPFVEEDYFQALKALNDLVAAGDSGLYLLGMEPNCPSEKYGYIIPESQEKVSKVSSFKEKPNAEKAKAYIEQGALWNMGVFGFKLSYLLKKAHELIDFEDYDDLFNRYNEAKKISFDYAVVEQEPNIHVMRFGGRWDDLGTWEALTNAMTEKTVGKAFASDCEDTRIVNELDIPVVALGLKDVLVACSSDGILVSDLKKANNIKPIVEKFESGEIRYAEKSWGKYQVIDVGPTSLTISLEIKAGSRLSYHSHDRRDEVWTVVFGKGLVTVDGMSQHLHPGDVISIARGCRHTVEAIEDLKIIEVQLGDEINVDDKHKYEYE